MKKIISSLLIIFCIQIAFAQRSAFYQSDNRLFDEGKAMFEDGNYPGCIDKLKAYRQIATDRDLLAETDYLLLACGYRQGKSTVIDALKNYLDDHSETIHSDEICFMIGSCHFESEEYPQAVHWFKRSNLDNLSEKNQEDYAYRLASSYLQTGKGKEESRRLFGLLSQNSEKYRDAAVYYLACLDYEEKNYNPALSAFNTLKNNKQFQPEVLYYIAQINFVQKRYSQTIKEGKELLSAYPDNVRNPELNRIVGVSYYMEENYDLAGSYLLKYVQTTSTASRNDLYLLGLSLYNTQKYNQAIEYFGRVISTNDALGQNANFSLGQSYLKVGNLKNALLAFETAAQVNFDIQTKEAATYNYAMLLYQTSTSSSFGESVTVLENFLNTYPQSVYSDKINNCLVEVYLTTKNYDTALKSIEKIKNPGAKILEAKQKILYHLGTVYFTNAHYDEAINYFTQAIHAGNHAAEEKARALYWRGESYYRKNQFDMAINDFHAFKSQATRFRDISSLANYNLAYCYFNQNEYVDAQQLFSSYISQETDKKSVNLADAYARLGDCYFHFRNFSSAENAYSQSASLQPSMSDYVIYQKGFVLGLQKDYKAKIAQMDYLLKTYPDSRYVPDALYEKGRAYVMLENSRSAIDTYNQLLLKYPDSRLARKAGLQIGLLYFNDNEPQKAVDAYKKVIAKYPGSEEAKVAVQDLKSVYVDLNKISEYAQYVKSLDGSVKFESSEQDSLTYLAAEKFFTKGDIAQAQSALKNYIQIYPNGAFITKAHYYLGNTYHNRKEYELAKKEYQQVLASGNTLFVEETLVRLSEIQYAEKDYSAALESYQKLSHVAETRSGKEAGLMGSIRCANFLNNYAEVLTASGKLLKESNLSPELSVEAKYYQAKAYLGLKESAKALPVLKEVAKDTRTSFGAEAKYQLAQQYFDQKQYDKAESEVLDYIKVGTPHAYWLARGFILLSDVYIVKKDYLQARQYLESLQQNYKTTDDIQDMIGERLSKLKN